MKPKPHQKFVIKGGDPKKQTEYVEMNDEQRKLGELRRKRERLFEDKEFDRRTAEVWE